MKPSLDLTVVVEGVDGGDGVSFPVSADRDAENQMFVQSFSSKLNVGYESFSGLIPRDFRRTYGSPRILQSLRVVDAGGNTVWEGRVDNVPPGRNNSVAAVGWWDGFKDAASVAEVYVDAEISKWGEMSIAEKARLATLGVDFASLSWSAEGGAIVCALPNQALGAQVIAQSWYTAPPGALIGSVKYTGSNTSMPAGYDAAAIRYPATGDLLDATDEIDTATMDGTEYTSTAATARRYVMTQVYSNGSAVTPTSGANRKFTSLKVFGDHGLSNIYASEVIKHAVGKYCPLITADSNSIYDTTYAIGQMVFDGVTVEDVINRCNAFHLYEVGVWNARTLWFQPQRDTDDYDYLLSIFEGDELDVEGPRVDDDEPCNGVWVYYTDVATGRRERVGPYGTATGYDSSGDTSLLVTDDGNPCNREGVNRFPSLEVSFNCTESDAIQLGSLWLAEKQVPVSIGTGTATAHIRNRAGAWAPAHNIKAGDRVKYTHEDVIRRVYSVSYDPTGHRASLSFERPPATFDGINERINLRLQAANL